jgi:hypothetical protein
VETVWQCQDRYGPEIGGGSGWKLFRKGGLIIDIKFFDGRAESITFEKEQKDALGSPEAISENEIKLLLDANGNGEDWVEDHILSIDRQWSAKGGTLVGFYMTLKHAFGVYTKESADRFYRAKAPDEAVKL